MKKQKAPTVCVINDTPIRVRKAKAKLTGDPVRIICMPLMDALLHTALEGSKLAQVTQYTQGCDLVTLCSDTMGKINLIVKQSK